ncbi:SRPBCC family protein [Roseateles sp. LKC17W]|uniref:SRPBCC family protein n=1 Tax=Pelomonas margarita TaxID=3299031 RepID=A0ABW7FEF0_9BURK
MQFEHTQRIAAAPARIFARYADVASWRDWDADLKASSLDGAFVSGATGVVEPKSGPKSTVRFVDVKLDQGFAVECRLPLCTMRFEYELHPTGGGTLATHRVVFKGALGWFFGRVIGSGMRKDLPKSMQRLEQVVLQSA